MHNSRISKMAKLLVEYCVELKPNQSVIIRSSHIALPLLREVYREAIKAGAFPYVEIEDEEMLEILYKEGNDAQLAHIPTATRDFIERYDARIGIMAPINTRFLAGVDRDRQSIRRRAFQPLMKTFMERSADRSYLWVTTAYPTPSAAQDADMSLSDYADFVYGAMKLDADDPVAEWQKLQAYQQKAVDWLAGKKQLTVKGANVDLTLSIAGRTFINDEGKANLPGGEIFTAPVEDSVNGWVRFSYPAIYGGREVDGVELTFEHGKVTQATAAKGQDYLLSVLDTDAGSRTLGEWAIGSNDGIQKFTRNMLFDEKIGGTIHMALGAAYPETGGVNQSAVHWDMLCDMRQDGEITADGELFYRAGKFLI